MNLTALARRFHWLQMPTGLLVLFLQRTPMLRVVVAQFEGVLSENAPAILRSAFGVVAMGAYNSLAGATTFNVTATPVAASPTSGRASASFTIAGTSGTAMNIGISVSGAPGNPLSWGVTGALPTGLSVTGGNPVNVVAPFKMYITGTPSAAGSYPVTVTAYSTAGAKGDSARITVTFNITGGVTGTVPSFTTQPTSVTVTAGGSASFTVAASGSPAPTYQWQKGGVDISGATNATYSITSTASGDAGSYTAVATNSAGSATSSAATLTVNAATIAPGFTTQPVGMTVTAGGSASFTVAASGNPTPTYQWQKGGVNISGATNATYTIASTAASDAGTYAAVATNSAGSATSSGATLTVNVPPTITTQPASATVTAGGSVSFNVAANGSPTPTYQWQKGGVNISGAANATYTIASTAASDAGTYTAVATNSAGSVTSSSATLTVNAAPVAPVITTQPASLTVTAGSAASFTVAASGNPAPSYQWQKVGVNIAGATSATYSIANTAPGDAGTYTAVASNSAGSATSSTATLTVNVAPAITTQPVSVNVMAGNAASFTVAASGNPAPSYQWQKGGVNIAGATSATYSIASTVLSDAGSYTALASNSAGAATSAAATLTVTASPVFTAQPQSQTALVGSTVTFTAGASGSPAPIYQWTKGGAAIAGANSATLTLASVQLTDAATYAVIATNSVGSVTSSGAVLTVSALPTFTTQPQNQSALVGGAVTFTAAASGTPAPTYQWTKGGTTITGATSATLILNGVQLTDAATYAVIATNSVGSVTSSAAVLTVTARPVFTTQPQSQSALVGGTVTFTATASGTPAPNYQWAKGGTAIAGATSATFILNGVQFTDAATYTVVATNTVGSVTSSGAVLTVSAPPAFTTQPQSQSALVGSAVTFTAAASGTPAPTYQWTKGGTPIAGATGAMLTLGSVQFTDAATYAVVATNSVGSVTSSGAMLTVTAPPVLTTQPQSQSALVGGTVTFTATASGTPAPNYQWAKGGTAIAGATSATFTLNSVQLTDAATYTVVATNSVGSVASNGAVLTVSAPPTFTTQPQNQSTLIGGTVTFTVVANGLPAPTYQWVKGGTAIAGATGASLTLSNVQLTDAATYTVVVANSVGSVTSSGAVLTVSAVPSAPSFTTQPQNQAAILGGTAIFIAVSSGTPTPTYQWTKGGTAIPGATSAMLTLSNVQLADAATYAVVATNSAGSATSSSAVLAVNVPPAFTTQPLTQTVLVGATVTLTAAANGTPAPTYQWAKDGAAVAGATGATFTLTNVQLSAAATYTAVATNSAGSVTSAGAVLTVNTPTVAPAITTAPQRQTVIIGGNVSFTVAASGTPAPTFQWQKGGIPIAGAAGPTLTLSNVQWSDAATYTVVATNSAGSVTSAGAALTVTSLPPTITSQPTGHTVSIGTTTLLSVEADGNGLTYQWAKNGDVISGATSARLMLDSAQTSDAGNYTVTVTNSGGGSVTSDIAALSVVAPADPGRIVNLSILGTSAPGDGVLIMGFVVGPGNTSGFTPFLIRGVGPTIIPAPYSVTNALADPALQLVSPGDSTVIASNDNWGGTVQLKLAAVMTGAFPLASDTSLDAALLSALPQGAYTVIVSGKSGATGRVLAETYDASSGAFDPTAPRLINVSARAHVGGTDTLTAGFVVAGSTAKTLLIRGVGPDPLFSAAVGGANLSDPMLALYRAENGVSTQIFGNDNWGGDPQVSSLGAKVGAFALSNPASKDAVMAITLDPGPGIYSVQVTGVNGSTGITLLEVYELP